MNPKEHSGSVSRRKFLKSAAASTAAGGLLLGSTGTAAADGCSGRERTLQISGNGVKTAYHFKIMPVYENCEPRPIDTESNDEVEGGYGGFAINGVITGDTDKWEFSGVIDKVSFTQLESGDSEVIWNVSASEGMSARDGWYDIEMHAEQSDKLAILELYPGTTAKEEDNGGRLESCDYVNNAHISTCLNGDYDYYEGYGEFTAGIAHINGQRTVGFDVTSDT